MHWLIWAFSGHTCLGNFVMCWLFNKNQRHCIEVKFYYFWAFFFLNFITKAGFISPHKVIQYLQILFWNYYVLSRRPLLLCVSIPKCFNKKIKSCGIMYEDMKTFPELTIDHLNIELKTQFLLDFILQVIRTLNGNWQIFVFYAYNMQKCVLYLIYVYIHKGLPKTNWKRFPTKKIKQRKGKV